MVVTDSVTTLLKIFCRGSSAMLSWTAPGFSSESFSFVRFLYLF